MSPYTKLCLVGGYSFLDRVWVWMSGDKRITLWIGVSLYFNLITMDKERHKIITDKINMKIEWHRQNQGFNCKDISDWYHTFRELYQHRIHLFIALCKMFMNLEESKNVSHVFKSRIHNDWLNVWDEWWMFIVQLDVWWDVWQISYHLPNEYWDKCDFIPYLPKANEWDWHTSDDVLERLLLI